MMNQVLAVILPMLFFVLIDFIIMYHVYKHKNNAKTRTIFLFMTVANFVQQLFGTISYLFDYQILSAPDAVQYVVYLCMFTAMAFTSFEWFRYLRMLLAEKQDLSKNKKILFSIPVGIIFWMVAVSPWTHWILWIDENGVYQRGTLYFLQFICAYIYVVFAIVALIFYRKCRKSVYRKKVYTNFIMFILPAILGTVLQVMVFQGGYTMIGMSIAVLLIYLDLYVDEVNENQRLQLAAQEQAQYLSEVTELNRSLEEQMKEISFLNSRLEDAAEEKEAQLAEITALNEAALKEQKAKEREHGVVEALSASYLNVYIINTVEQTVEILKLNGYVTNGMSKEKTGPYPYAATCRAYISNRVYGEDQQMVADCMRLDNLLLQLKNRKEYEFTYRVPENDGISYYQGKYVSIDGDYIVCGFQNIDEIVKKEKEQKEELQSAYDRAEAASKAKTSFLFNMSHDIRTPMNAIIGFTELLKKHKNEADKIDDYIGKIQSSSDFLLSLINNVLEMARIESGKTTLDESVFQVGEICNEITSIYGDLMKKKNITFSYSVDCQTKYIYGDTVKLREIWLNIVSNAYKYTPEGGAVSISTIELPSGKEGYACLQTTFTDTGIGMSKEYLEVIFEEFTREHTSTESQVQGTGLGMPIVKKLVDLMGGTITVESELGKGSKFTVSFMHRIGENPRIKAADGQKAIDYQKFEGKRILLAEDNELNAEIAIEILSDAGFKVEQAADGVICVDMLQKEECGYYDLILMDIQMPNLDGYQATKVIRSMNDPFRSQIPIIAMTANAFEEDKRNALAAGMNDHLAKPLEIPKLMETLAQILK